MRLKRSGLDLVLIRTSCPSSPASGNSTSISTNYGEKTTTKPPFLDIDNAYIYDDEKHIYVLPFPLFRRDTFPPRHVLIDGAAPPAPSSGIPNRPPTAWNRAQDLPAPAGILCSSDGADPVHDGGVRDGILV